MSGHPQPTSSSTVLTEKTKIKQEEARMSSSNCLTISSLIIKQLSNARYNSGNFMESIRVYKRQSPEFLSSILATNLQFSADLQMVPVPLPVSRMFSLDSGLTFANAIREYIMRGGFASTNLQIPSKKEDKINAIMGLANFLSLLAVRDELGVSCPSVLFPGELPTYNFRP